MFFGNGKVMILGETIMKRSNAVQCFSLVTLISVFFIGGCGGGNEKAVPHMGFGNFGIRTELSRDDIEVLGRVEGSSTTESILLGLIQIVDGDKLKLMGIPFFTEKCISFSNESFGFNPTQHRAYYKALESAPEADVVFNKSMDYERSGIPLIWWTETVTYKGKAIKLKSD